MYSMTGYGRCDLERDGRAITLEMKSVNHRFLDLSFRMPRTFAYLEDALRALIGRELSRGHVDVFINYRNLRKDAKTVLVDEGLLQGYMQALEKVEGLSGLPSGLNALQLARLPDVLSVAEQAEDLDALKSLTLEAAQAALAQLKAMRQAEGQRMGADIALHLEEVRSIVQGVSQRAPMVVQEYRQRLTERLAELLENAPVDEGRITQEVAIYTDRVAVDEEIARLGSHLSSMEEAMASAQSMGRRLDFIVQEMNREANTIGSKASDAPLIQLVVSLKSEIEKIREQVQNIE